MVEHPYSLEESDGYFWMRGNLHSHTTESDGHVAPQARVDQYAGHGYEFLCLSDHNRITDPTPLSTSKDFVLIPGVELHPPNPYGGQTYHFLASGVETDIDAENMEPQDVIDNVLGQGGLVWAAHPYWSGVNAFRDYMPLRGIVGVEVYNTTSARSGRGESSIVWDDWMSLLGNTVPAVANDDCHSSPEHGTDEFQAWTMVRVRERTAAAVIEALRSGNSYCSTGPEIHSVELKTAPHPVSGKPVPAATLKTSAVQRIVAVCDIFGADWPMGPSQEVFEEATVYMSPGIRWVRFEAIDQQGNKAWTNPIVMDSGLS